MGFVRGCTATLALTGLVLLGCGPRAPEAPPEEAVKVPGSGTVVVYVEAPRYLAGPVLKTFSDQSGITVEAHYREQEGPAFFETLKSEATAGKADVFWGVSPLSAVALTRAGLTVPFRPAGARPVPGQYRDAGYRWIGFVANPRIIVFNQNQVTRENAPQSLDDLTTGRWAGKAVLPRIAEGPAAFQAAALFARRGEDRAREFFDRIRATGNRIVDSEAEVRRLVAAGESDWGVMGLDQAICAKRQADPLHIFFPDRMGLGAVAVPHVEAVLRGAPHPDQAKGLAGYLFSTEAAWQFGQNDCALLSLLPIVEMGIPKPDWVPLLGGVNILPVDNDLAYDAFVKNASYFASWGAPPAGAPAATGH
jgi:iron(III) transport system substrate-binding protein